MCVFFAMPAHIYGWAFLWQICMIKKYLNNYLKIFVCLFRNALLCYINHTQTHKAMKKYILTIEIKTSNFYINNLESFTIGADNRKDAIVKGRIMARQEDAKFINVRLVRN